MTDRHLVDITEQIGDPVSHEERQRLYDRYAWVRQYVHGKTVFEAACGTGQGVSFLARSAASILGTDLSQTNVDLAHSAFGADVPVAVGSAVPIPFANGSLDVVVMLEALYFLPDADAFVSEAFRALRPGGVLLVTTNNKDSLNFSPNWMGNTYYGAPELAAALQRAGFSAAIMGGCVIEDKAQRGGMILALKNAAQSLGLVPKNKRLRQLLKRMMYGRPSPLERDIPDGITPPPLDSLERTTRYPKYKILYAVGTKPA